MKTAITVCQTKRPVSGDTIGYRIKVAHWNLARYVVTDGSRVPSFAKPYLFTESGDYVGPPSDGEISKFLKSRLNPDQIKSLVWA